MPPVHDRPVVLIVEDEQDLADLYTEWLSDKHEVRTAYTGKEALNLIDDSVDVVLLDRRIPDLSGTEILNKIRANNFSCRVAMVTAVEPDVDIIEMGFDDYLVKPVTQTDLHETVDNLLARSTYDEQMQEYFSLVSKKAVLETEMDPGELKASKEYTELNQRIQELHNQLNTTLDNLSDGDFESVFRELRPIHDSSSNQTSDE